MITDQEIRALADEATEGPWEEAANAANLYPADAAFIAAAREWVPDALTRFAAIRELHQPDWSDWDIDHPEEEANCTCGYNGSYSECPTVRILDRSES